MTNLAISNNKLQPSGNTTNVLQTNIAADSLAVVDAQSVEPFAFLLARQIGETGLPPLTTAQTAVAPDGNAERSGTDPAMEDMQGQTSAINLPDNLASTLTAILLQLPAPENGGQKVEIRQTAPLIALDHPQEINGKQTTISLSPGFSREAAHEKPIADLAGSQLIQLASAGTLPPGIPGHAEPLSGQAQPAPGMAQAIASPTTPSALPAPALPAPALPTLTTPLGNHGWADEFSQKIIWIGTQQNQVAELHLNPPNLGPLDVILKISDNQATALFASPHSAVRDAVENALPKLREVLADNGITLGNTTISDQPPRDRSMNEFMSQGPGTAVQNEFPRIASDPGSPLAAALPARRHNGMVDTFA